MPQKVEPAMAQVQSPALENLRILPARHLLVWLLRHCLWNFPNLQKLTIQLSKVHVSLI
jgi:hypothetical protein